MDVIRDALDEIKKRYPPYDVAALVDSLVIHDKNLDRLRQAMEEETANKQRTYELIELCRKRDKEIANAKEKLVQAVKEAQEGL